MNSVFHLAINVTDLEMARAFYGDVLGCRQGRSASTWVDFDFFGHQLSLHLGTPLVTQNSGNVDNVKVPMPHFGAIVDLPLWQVLADKLQNIGTSFILAPTLRFEGEPGEQHTMFFNDPFGNPIELKGVRHWEEVFNI